MRALNIAYVMDPIAAVNIKKDSTFAMMEAAQARGHHNFYLHPEQLYYRDGRVHGLMQPVTVQREDVFYQLGETASQPLAQLDAVLMRKDPPFNMPYIYSTYLLEQAMHETLVLNHPVSLRNANEKLYALNFPDLIPRTIVACDRGMLRAFVLSEGRAILKPIDAKGGEGVFVIKEQDSNLNALLDLMTHEGQVPIIAQQYIPEAAEGDKRVLMIDGEVVSAFRRVPAAGEHRANLNAGGQAVACDLSERDLQISRAVGASLHRDGLAFVGLDLIGDYLIEVNVTSPTGIQEAKKLTGVDTAERLMQWIESKVAA
ncbi:MAG: glutathione synthase [Candidatus Melainabacteria bacterium HGW-Melainabacteria-1]|nr:MAG: glutathione synthase [Candidatus Melainabacteria bacterium HGW-Melainabacteria-1]